MNPDTLHDLGKGAAVRFEDDGGLTLYLDHAAPGSPTIWRVACALPPEQAVALRRLLLLQPDFLPGTPLRANGCTSCGDGSGTGLCGDCQPDDGGDAEADRRAADAIEQGAALWRHES